MSDRDQQDECPKAFYCLPESCVDCPHDQQDEQAAPMYGRDQICRHGHILYSCTACARNRGIAEGERAATERIVKWLRSDRWVGFRSTCMSLADAIERGEHE